MSMRVGININYTRFNKIVCVVVVCARSQRAANNRTMLTYLFN